MPSVGVGMRRTTRVFGARVLRSGRRVWTGPGGGEVGKHMRAAANGNELVHLLDNSGDGAEFKENGWHHNDGILEQTVTEMDVDVETLELESVEKSLRNGGLKDENGGGRMWGVVYQRRKRKKVDSKSNLVCLDNEEMTNKVLGDSRKFGKHFARKQSARKRLRQSTPVGDSPAKCRGQVLVAVIESESSFSSSWWFTCFLNLVLRHMRSVRVRMDQLFEFLTLEPITRVYLSHGIHFLQDSTPIRSFGVCKIWGVKCFIPLFSVDFSAIPFCFKYFHISLYLKSACLSNNFVMSTEAIDMKANGPSDEEECMACVSCERDQSGSQTAASGNDPPGNWRGVLHNTSSTVPKLGGRNVQFRNGVNTRSMQKRRSSLRSRRGRKPSVFGARKNKGALATDLFSFKHNGFPVSPQSSQRVLGTTSSVRRSSTTNVKKEIKSALVGSTQDMDSTYCSANLLIVESDKCYREEGAIITLEVLDSKEWLLAVKKEGIVRYRLTAQKVMRPCSCNRITHSIIWTEDNSWKLEFINRNDWLIFKQLYKECFDRNVQPPICSIIHVPGVHEVLGFSVSDAVPFMRPDSYITVKDDEVTRALAKGTVIYDMDSDDEKWLTQLNDESSRENKLHEKLSSERLELIIDAFERGFYCSPDDYSDEKTAVNLSLDLERREVLEAAHSYWIKKRKQKRSALVRLFQCYLPKRAPLIPKLVLRKKRSFKRPANIVAREKQRTFSNAVAAEQAAMEDQNILNNVQEAKAAAIGLEGLAVLKRQRAQLLMGNADLAAYKATMALRVAQAVEAAESPEDAAAASLFFKG